MVRMQAWVKSGPYCFGVTLKVTHNFAADIFSGAVLLGLTYP